MDTGTLIVQQEGGQVEDTLIVQDAGGQVEVDYTLDNQYIIRYVNADGEEITETTSQLPQALLDGATVLPSGAVLQDSNIIHAV